MTRSAPPDDDGLHPTDLGNALRLSKAFGHELRWVPAWDRWLVWSGSNWVSDQEEAALSRARLIPRLVHAEAATCEGDKASKELGRWAIDSEARHRIENAVRLAKGDPALVVRPDALDRHVDKLNTPSGTVELRTGVLRPHDRAEMHTKVTRVAPDRQWETPGFDSFLAHIQPDPEMRPFLQRSLGYSATGRSSEQVVFFAHGGGANGKSTLLNIVRKVLGDYAHQAPQDLLIARRHDPHPTERAALAGKRFVLTMESSEGRRLNDGLVKALAGGDAITAHFMRRDDFTFEPTFTLWMAVNHLPMVADHTRAMWRRIKRVPFDVTIPDDAQVKDFDEKLVAAEGPGILAWIIEGAVEWYRSGLAEPLAVEVATEAYHQHEDSFLRFREEALVLADGAKVANVDLIGAYKTWCSANGVIALSMQALGERLGVEGCERTSLKRAGKTVRGWAGVGVVESAREDSDG